MSNIMDLVKEAPVFAGRKSWTELKEPYFFLIQEKGYSRIAASDYIAKLEGLSAEDSEKFYEASRKWAMPK